MIRCALPCFLILSPILALALVGRAGLRFNYTDSFPEGVYRAVSKYPEKGDLVAFLPPALPVFDLARDRGYIERGECMLKRFVAAGGDVVTIDAGGVTVNGRTLPNSVPCPADLAGRPMPACRLKERRLSRDEVLVMSDYSRVSFDGRYFGPIPRSCLKSVIRPLWTW